MEAIVNRLAEIRGKRGLAAARVAEAAGVSRQTIYAIEAGSYVPNTALALKLARILEVAVEELFALPPAASSADLHSEEAILLEGGEEPHVGQPVQLCRVDRRMLASAPAPMPWCFPASDAVVCGSAGAKLTVQVFHPEDDYRNRLLVAGCDPAISVLARHTQAAGVELVLAHRNSSQALRLLKEGVVHVAGTHLRDESSGESNLPEIGRMFPKRSVAVISYAVWEEGIVTAPGNPKAIRGIEDMARPGVSIINREPGAGSRKLLDSRLSRLGIAPGALTGYDREAAGHLAAAWHVWSGAADCCVATRAAARCFGLGFIPLVSERYDLAMRKAHFDLPAVQAMLDILSRASFRRELEALGGYDTRAAGDRML